MFTQVYIYIYIYIRSMFYHYTTEATHIYAMDIYAVIINVFTIQDF